MRATTALGAWGEQAAVEYLQHLGWTVLDRNWRCRHGELDVVVQDAAGRTVVFVEVKTRRTDRFGGAMAAVTPAKVARLRRLAGLWLAAQPRRWPVVRIDVIGVRLGADAPEVQLLEGVG